VGSRQKSSGPLGNGHGVLRAVVFTLAGGLGREKIKLVGDLDLVLSPIWAIVQRDPYTTCLLPCSTRQRDIVKGGGPSGWPK